MGTLENYFDDIPKVLLNFQLLEEALRNYLARCEGFTLVKVKGVIDYKLDLKYIEKASLGKLVELFEKRNKNTKLIERLSKIVPDRNFFAHEAYTRIYEKGKASKTKVETNYERLKEVISNSKECMLDVWTEIVSIENRFSGKDNVTRKYIDDMIAKLEAEEFKEKQ